MGGLVTLMGVITLDPRLTVGEAAGTEALLRPRCRATQ